MEVPMTIEEAINQIRYRNDSTVLPPCGLPSVKAGCELPHDVAEFYHLCGGIKIRRFKEIFFSWEIVCPARFVSAPSVVHRGFYDSVESFWREHWAQSLYWFAQTEGAGEAIVVDCRLGTESRFLNADTETFGCDEMPRISQNLGDLLIRLLEAEIGSMPKTEKQ